ncbi:MAG: deoxynucleoside kinase [Mangrovibacterium sp.]
MRISYLVIEGNIGAGKTSLVKMIARDFGARMLLEGFKDNPFLPKFYEDQAKYAFPLEMSFLADRYNQLKKHLGEFDLFSSFLVSDYYFAKSLIFAQNTLADDEFRLYRRFFDIIYDKIPKPDLYVYLHSDTDTLLKNIHKRNRAYEQNIKREYLEKISEGYFNFFKHIHEFPILLIDMSNLDFIENSRHYKTLISYLFDYDYSPGINRIN